MIPIHIDTSSKAQGIALQTVPKQVGVEISFSLKMGTDRVPQWSLCSFKNGIIDGQKVNQSKLFTILLILPGKKKCTLSLNDIVVTVHCLNWYCLPTLATR